MNYGQIIGQAWQILKRTRILWVLGLIPVLLYFDKFIEKTDTLGLACIYIILLSVLLFFYLFYPFALITAAEQVIQSETPQFKKIWMGFWNNLGRQILYILACVITGLLGLICSYLLLRLLFLIFHIHLSDFGWNINLTASIGAPFVIGFTVFGFYDLIIDKKGIIESLRHGFNVLTANLLKCITLSFCFQFPIWVSRFVIWGLFYRTNIPLIHLFSQALATFPGDLLIAVITTIIFLLQSISFLLAYHLFTEKQDPAAINTALAKT